MGDEFEDATEVMHRVVDRRGSEKEQGLGSRSGLMNVGLEFAVARWSFHTRAGNTGVSEMVRFVDDDHIGIGKRSGDFRLKLFRCPLQIGVVVEFEIDESRARVGQATLDFNFPNILSGSLGRKEHHSLVFLEHSLDEHEPHKCFAQTHAVTKKRAAISTRDVHHVLVGIALITSQQRKNLRRAFIPLIGREFMGAQVFVKRLEPDLERCVWFRVAFKGLQDVGGDIFRIVPVGLVPILKQSHFRSANLDVELDVLG